MLRQVSVLLEFRHSVLGTRAMHCAWFVIGLAACARIARWGPVGEKQVYQ